VVEHDVDLRVGGDAQIDEPNRGASMTTSRRLLLIVALAFAGRVAYVLGVTRHDRHITDAFWYTAQANRIGEAKGIIVPLFTNPTRPSAYHPPLTSIVLAPVARLTNGNETAMRLMMAFLGCLVVLAIALIAKELAGDRAAVIAAVLAAIYPNLWMNDGLLLSETITTLLVAVVILLAYRFTRRPSLRLAIAIGIGCGLGMLARAELGLELPLIVVPAFLLTARLAIRRRVELAGIAILVALITVSPWVIRNLATFERPVFLSTGDGAVLHGANCAKTYSGELLGFWDPFCGSADVSPDLEESVADARQRRLGIEYMTSHPGGLAKAAAARLGRVWSVYRPLQMADLAVLDGRPKSASVAGVVFFYVLVPPALIGALILRRRRVTLVPLLGQFALVTIVAVAFYGVVRFRVPAEVSLLVLVSIALDAPIRARSRS
jgi:4-amino-4-deoxy-L-arabinose transferase-like glycosyltransferase